MPNGHSIEDFTNIIVNTFLVIYAYNMYNAGIFKCLFSIFTFTIFIVILYKLLEI